MIDTAKRRKLAHELLRFIGLSAAVSLFLFWGVSSIALRVAETYCFDYDIVMTEFDWIKVDRWIFSVSAVLSCITFSVIFLCLLGDRIAYIRKITAGINALHTLEITEPIPLEWNNELTELAAAINDMAEAQQKIREKEQTLANEKEQLIRALSHDIRTPLTSILAYSDYLVSQQEVPVEVQKAHLEMIRKKAEQIRELTEILLDGSRRNPEHFDDGKLLMEQIAEEFQEELEEQFTLFVDFNGCPPFSGTFDVQELRRVFDNLSSNVRKYADPSKPVTLSVELKNGSLLIQQCNGILSQKSQSEGYRIGLNSIRRIAQSYGGNVSVEQSQGQFKISISLCNF